MSRAHRPNIDPKKQRRPMTPVDHDEQYIDDHFGGVYADSRGKDTEEEMEITRDLVRKYKEDRAKSSD